MAKKDEAKVTDKTQIAWTERFTNAMEKLPDELSIMQFEHAIIQYGVFGKEPKFVDTKECKSWVLEAIFEACRTTVDSSRESFEQKRRAAEASVAARKAKKEAKNACAKIATVNTKKEKEDKTWQAADCYDGPELTSSIPEYNLDYDESTCPF